MYLNFHKKDDKLVVDLIGELDHHYADAIRNKIDDKIDRDKINKVILNFEKVTFMDSSGIGVVVGRYKGLKSRNGELCIANVRNSVKKVFEIAGIFKVINCYENVVEALKCI